MTQEPPRWAGKRVRCHSRAEQELSGHGLPSGQKCKLGISRGGDQGAGRGQLCRGPCMTWCFLGRRGLNPQGSATEKRGLGRTKRLLRTWLKGLRVLVTVTFASPESAQVGPEPVSSVLGSRQGQRQRNVAHSCGGLGCPGRGGISTELGLDPGRWRPPPEVAGALPNPLLSTSAGHQAISTGPPP